MFRALAVVAILSPTSAVLAKDPAHGQAVDDPLAAIQQLDHSLESEGAKAFSESLNKALGNPKALALAAKLSIIEKKKPDVSSVVVDKKYGDAIRMIVEYKNGLSVEYPCIYFKYVYKRTRDGWVMTNFDFADEASEPFPKRFGID